VRRFDALTLSLAELVLNVLFAVLFLIGVGSALSAESTAAAGEPDEAFAALERERDELAAELAASQAAGARLRSQIDALRERMGRAGRSKLRPNCPGELFEGTVVSASRIRIEDELLPIRELGRRFPGTDRRTRPGCVHAVRVRFESMDGRSYERALRALENRYRVYREDRTDAAPAPQP